MKTAMFLGFTVALLQVGHLYGGGIDTVILLARVVEGRLNLTKSHRKNEARACSEPIFPESSEVHLLCCGI